MLDFKLTSKPNCHASTNLKTGINASCSYLFDLVFICIEDILQMYIKEEINIHLKPNRCVSDLETIHNACYFWCKPVVRLVFVR